MSRSQRRSDPSIALSRLEERHRVLKQQVAEYESRLTLTTSEQVTLMKLKKEKLATKDALHRQR